MKHAHVEIGDYKIPLIGIPMSSTQERCDRCGEENYLRSVRYTGRQFLCPKCDSPNHPKP